MALESSAGPDEAANDRVLAEHAAIFGPFPGYRPPEEGMPRVRSVYVPMRDGVRIAIDEILPPAIAAGVRVPALLVTTRYWRAQRGRPPSETDLFFAGHGYAVIRADERGTGASFGRWRHPWSSEAIADYGELAGWITRQPWSNGRIGAIGTSYAGTTAQLLAVPNHPAVRAVVPKAIELDVYADVAFPGGVFLEWLIRGWTGLVESLDANRFPGAPAGSRGVKPVDEDTDGSLLARAVAEHASAPRFSAMEAAEFRDDRPASIGATWDDFSVHTFQKEIERSGVAIYGWGSWFDGLTADAVLRRFVTFRNPQRAVIGPWSHGAAHHVSPYLPPDTPVSPSVPAQRLEDLRFFGAHLKSEDAGAAGDRVLIYYTFGEEKWKRTAVWPPEGTTMRRAYLAPGGRLSPEAPPSTSGADVYRVDFSASTGKATRWHTELDGSDVVYPDRAEEDRRLLTYTSDPLPADLEITGHPSVTLWLTSTHSDGAFHAYLEDVQPDGRVTYLAEGHLRARARGLAPDTTLDWRFGPRSSFRRRDARPLIPGRAARLSFFLSPISVLVGQGHRVRLAVAGHDDGLFARIPADGHPIVTILRDLAHPSTLDLPVALERGVPPFLEIPPDARGIRPPL